MSLSSVTSRTFSSTTSLQSLPLGPQILRLVGMEALEALHALEVRETKPKPRWPRSVWRSCNPSVPRTPSFQLLGAPDISSPLMSSILQLYMLYSSIFKASMWLCMILQWLMLVSDWHGYGETTSELFTYLGFQGTCNGLWTSSWHFHSRFEVDFAFASPETEEDVSIWKLVTAGQDGCVKLWAVPLPKPSQKTLRRPRWLCTMKHEAAVNCARWSPTGRMIASCDAEAGKQPTSLAFFFFQLLLYIIIIYPDVSGQL